MILIADNEFHKKIRCRQWCDQKSARVIIPFRLLSCSFMCSLWAIIFATIPSNRTLPGLPIGCVDKTWSQWLPNRTGLVSDSIYHSNSDGHVYRPASRFSNVMVLCDWIIQCWSLCIFSYISIEVRTIWTRSRWWSNKYILNVMIMLGSDVAPLQPNLMWSAANRCACVRACVAELVGCLNVVDVNGSAADGVLSL